MALTEYQAEIATGRRGSDGRVCLSLFTTDMMALTLEGHGERVPTLLLSKEQTMNLRDALSEVITLLEEDKRKKVGEDSTDVAIRSAAVWQGAERRASGQLSK